MRLDIFLCPSIIYFLLITNNRAQDTPQPLPAGNLPGRLIIMPEPIKNRCRGLDKINKIQAGGLLPVHLPQPSATVLSKP
jgi:hypothetical protein